ncbi:ABC transporter permease [Hespellia stercorisuis]|uniref:ABC-2 type transport system permease protein n=1 Tax=Hespellia stercorisuis DSM 15480 TaxID=1121950 RepID=A0A1M6TRU2_9FIRM|nr:ABC transporter permease [Hespellia stercorisuis]SHK59657.1 ABC-2 type transport system permease protein [Hespellia stercorisuis DSM 15480]
MLHLIKYRFICTLRDRTSMFWAMAFPLILATLFFFAFSNIGKNKLDTIPVALVQSTESEAGDAFGEFLKEMAEDDSKIIKVEELSEKKALDRLKTRKVYGIYYAQETPALTVASEGIEESVLQSLLDSYNRNADMMRSVAQEKPEGIGAAAEAIADYRNLVKETSINGKEVNGVLQYFLALIAMACLYGCFLGFTTSIELQANQSDLAIRRSITPTHRLKLVFVDLIVTFAVHFVNLMILLAYLKYVLKLDLGENMGGTVLVCAVGGLIGVAMGIFIGSCGNRKEGVKIGIMLAVSMVCSFLAGLMMAQMKNVVEQYCPILNRINPAALISDALYCMSIYDNPARYARDLITLIAMAAAFTVGAFLMMRRERYDSI